jgi:hypothetical protein
VAERTEFIISAQDQTAAAFRSVEAGLGRLNSAMGGMLGQIAALTSAAGFGALIKSQIDFGDQLSKTSQKLGIAVEDLSAYQYAAKLSDVSNEQLTAGLSRLAKAMQDAAANPASQTAQAFRALGVSVTDAAGNLRPLNTVLEEVSRRFEETRDGTNKTAMAIQLFGRSGTELVPLLNGLRGLSEEARATGNIVSTEFAKKSEQFKDSMERMESAAGSLARTVAGPLVGALAELTERFNVAIGAQEKLSLDILSKDRAKAMEEYTRLAQAGLTHQSRAIQLVAQINQLDEQIIATNKRMMAMKAEQGAGGSAPEMASITGQGAGDKEAEQTVKYQLELQKQLETLNASIAPKQEALAMKFAMEQATLDEGYQLGLLSEQNYYALSAQLQADYEAKKTQAQQTEEKKRLTGTIQWMQQTAQLQQQGFVGQLQGAGIMLGQMSNLMQSSRKKEFELGKKAAIGQALINTFLGVSQALSYGFPLGLVFAAIQLAVGMANVARIRSQTFGGGGGATPTFNANPGTGLPEPVTPAEPIAPTLPASQQASTVPRTTIINVQSDSGMVSMNWLQDQFAPVFNEAVRDGGVANVRFVT